MGVSPRGDGWGCCGPADEEAVEGVAGQCAPNCAHGEVAHVMHAEVDARPAVEQCPREEGCRHGTAADGERHERGHGEGVGGVAREEAVLAAAVAAHHVDEVHYLRVVGGAEACHQRLEHARSHLVGHEDAQGNAYNYAKRTAQFVVAYDHVEQHHGQGQPRGCLRGRPCHAVHEQRVAAVEHERERSVKFEHTFV